MAATWTEELEIGKMVQYSRLVGFLEFSLQSLRVP